VHYKRLRRACLGSQRLRRCAASTGHGRGICGAWENIGRRQPAINTLRIARITPPWKGGCGGQTQVKEPVMPKMSEREPLVDLEARQRKVAEEVEQARRALRGKYASLVEDVAVEKLSEREFKEVVTHAIRAGGAAAVAALKALPAMPPQA
jgi:hypothetical protein